jgi:hypothetical protein
VRRALRKAASLEAVAAASRMGARETVAHPWQVSGATAEAATRVMDQPETSRARAAKPAAKQGEQEEQRGVIRTLCQWAP